MTVFASGRGATCRVRTVVGVTAPNNAAAATEYSSNTDTASYNNITPTVDAATELLVVVAGGARDGTAFTSITLTSSVDGALSAKVNPSDPGAGRSFAGVWYLQSPTSGAHTITMAKQGGGNLDNMFAVVLQLKDVDATTPFETDFDYTATDATPSASANTMNGSITTAQNNSLVVAFAMTENAAATLPFTYNESLTVVHDGGATGIPAHGVATKVQATSGSSAWEIVASATEDWAAGAVAVRGKTT